MAKLSWLKLSEWWDPSRLVYGASGQCRRGPRLPEANRAHQVAATRWQGIDRRFGWVG